LHVFYTKKLREKNLSVQTKSEKLLEIYYSKSLLFLFFIFSIKEMMFEHIANNPSQPIFKN